MYRTVFTPTETNKMIPLDIPQEWYGRSIELILLPLDLPQAILPKMVITTTNKFKKIPSRYLFGTRKFKFSRDEANDYE